MAKPIIGSIDIDDGFRKRDWARNISLGGVFVADAVDFGFWLHAAQECAARALRRLMAAIAVL
jgi:hypothetical protein